jgi:Ribulose-5-phosphate 4-epimerase and related epimerases and aldolases
VRDLGDRNFLMLRNHGLLTVGRNVPEAFLNMFTFQRACEIQVLAQGHGAELIHIPQAVLDTVPGYTKAVTRGAGANLIWPGLLRRLERVDASYRT